MHTAVEITDAALQVVRDTQAAGVALESTRTIEIDEFVDRSEIDPRYLIRLIEGLAKLANGLDPRAVHVTFRH